MGLHRWSGPQAWATCEVCGNDREWVKADGGSSCPGEPRAGPSPTSRLRLSEAIRQEWSVRLPEDLEDVDSAPVIEVTNDQARRVLEDCKFQLDPLGPNLPAGVARAYLALARQCASILGVEAPAPKGRQAEGGGSA